jgi:signal transduction histidine kinase
MRTSHQQRPARRSVLRLPVAAPLDGRTWVRAGYLVAAVPIGWGFTAAMVLTLVPWALLLVLVVLLPLAALTVVDAAAAATRRRARTSAGTAPPAAARQPPGPPLVRLGAVAANPAAWLAPALAVGSAGTAVERALAGVVLRTRIPDPYESGEGAQAPSAWLTGAPADPATWRDAAYLALLAPLSIAWAAAPLALPVAVFLLTWPAWADPQEQLALGGPTIAIDTPPRRLLTAAAGLTILLLVAPLVRWLGGVRAHLARRLLGPSPGSELAARLAAQRAMREAAVRAHDADHRRIERDLHDGAQARLTALIMDLGRARKKLVSDPQAAQSLVDEAYQEARQALTELRDLARGIQPPILSDRGLDAAVSALSARAPIPVEVDVDVPTRPPAPVESTAYFIVAEALANVTKHAQATRARVQLRAADGRLVVEVSDNGVGGALPGAGTGLSGLTDRAAALDGRLTVSSPPGGPTLVRVELPCGS